MTLFQTAEEEQPQPSEPYRNTPRRRVLAFLRNTWRGLTSMRTALILLFLLALAALPGALLPQRSVDAGATADYIEQHGWWGQLLDALQFFDVYSSVWFSAIYLLLMLSLVGCLLPRSRDYIRSMRAKPVLTPRNLARMPYHDRAELAAEADEVFAKARTRLKGWRKTERDTDGSRSISAERGYLRETGNLVFHFALLGLIVSFAFGQLFSYEGQVIVVANGSQFCNSGIYAYDSFEPGLQVDGTGLNPFCVKVNDFNAEYTPAGQPSSYESNVQYQAGEGLRTGTWRPYHLEVNEPLRIAGDRIYLLDHGYAPTFTVTFPDGQVRTKTIQWRPVSQQTQLAEGATKFDPPGVTDPEQRREQQLAITGLFAPTAQMTGKVLSSAGPELKDPAVAVDIMRGDLGLGSGGSQSIFEIDQSMVEQGRLKRVARENLKLGESVTIANGTKIEFAGVEKFVALQISHNPTQLWVLGFAIAMLLGLGASLVIKRRRLWIRVTPVDGDDGQRHTVVEIAGLARTDQAGYGEEFHRIAEHLLGTAATSTGKRDG